MTAMTDSQKWFVAAAIILAGWLVYLLSPVITPFAVAAALAYLCTPVVNRLEKKGSRTAAVVLVFIMMIVFLLILLLILLPVLQEQVLQLIRRLPQLLAWIQSSLVPMVTSKFGIEPDMVTIDSMTETLKENWRELGDVTGLVLSKISTSGQTLMMWLLWLFLIPVVTFYLLRDWNYLLEKIRILLPERHEKTVVTLACECDRVLSEFLRGQLLVMLSLSVIYAAGLWLAGIEFALLIGLGAGLVSFIPYAGAIAGIGAAMIIAFIQYQDILHLVYVALVFGIGQTLESLVLSPWLVGERIGLHPVAVIFAVLAGGQLFGFLGVLLALPAAAVGVVLFRFAAAQLQSSDIST